MFWVVEKFDYMNFFLSYIIALLYLLDRRSQHLTDESMDPLIATELSSLNRTQFTAPA